MMPTESEAKALEILRDTSYSKPMKAAAFAKLMWPDSHMHKKVSNQGNGACVGKAAWLAGGSYLSKLENKSWVRKTFDTGSAAYHITLKGKDLVQKSKA